MEWSTDKKARQRLYNATWNDANREQRRSKTKVRKQELIMWLWEYKSKLSCEACGFSHPAALDFHHRDPTQKEFDISTLPRRGFSKERALLEIAKCSVLCANCHRILHSEEQRSSLCSLSVNGNTAGFYPDEASSNLAGSTLGAFGKCRDGTLPQAHLGDCVRRYGATLEGSKLPNRPYMVLLV
jgi:hypothetical protein